MADVTPYYAAAYVLVRPSKYDVFELVALGALAMGLYMVVTEAAGVSEFIDDGW